MAKEERNKSDDFFSKATFFWGNNNASDIPPVRDNDERFKLDNFFNKATFFWGNNNASDVPPVRDQRQREICYAYALTNVLFTAVKKNSGKCLLGSVDELAFELREGPKNERATIRAAFNYVLHHGLSLDTHYQVQDPTTSRKRKRAHKKKHKKIIIEGFRRIVIDEERHHTELFQVLHEQPVVAKVRCTRTFKNWHSDGIYSHADDDDGLGDGHAVTIFGYGTEDGVPYYIILNSYGKDWGHKGFAKVSLSVIDFVYYPRGTDYKKVENE